MYKLVAIDVDGTLVNDEGELTTRTINAIRNAIKKNVKIVISTARPFYRVKEYLKQLGLIGNIEDTIYNIQYHLMAQAL